MDCAFRSTLHAWPRTAPGAGPRRAARGLSLIEGLVTVGLIAIVAASALPSYRSLSMRRAVDGVATELATDLLWARSEAVARNEGVRVAFDAAQACYVIQAGDSGECRCAASGPAVCTGGATALKTVQLPPSPVVALQSSVRLTRFDPQFGTVTPAFTVRIEAASGPAVHQVVNLLGRVRSCSPQGAMPGYRPC